MKTRVNFTQLVNEELHQGLECLILRQFVQEHRNWAKKLKSEHKIFDMAALQVREPMLDFLNSFENYQYPEKWMEFFILLHEEF